MTFDDKTAARLKADQKRFIRRQTERLKAMGIYPAFAVSPDHVRVTDQKSYEDRDKPDILYGEWTAVDKDGEILVTRTEYGYLKNSEED